VGCDFITFQSDHVGFCLVLHYTEFARSFATSAYPAAYSAAANSLSFCDCLERSLRLVDVHFSVAEYRACVCLFSLIDQEYELVFMTMPGGLIGRLLSVGNIMLIIEFVHALFV
jgi:hypothetical protein